MFSKTGALSLSPYKGVFPYTELPTRVLMNLQKVSIRFTHGNCFLWKFVNIIER